MRSQRPAALAVDRRSAGQLQRIIAKTHTSSDNHHMDFAFDWSLEKNQQIIEQRGLSFEAVVSAIEQGGLLDVLEHPNQERYPGQRIYVVKLNEYAYLIPFVVQTEGRRYLKTIIPSRKATRDYLRRPST